MAGVEFLAMANSNLSTNWFRFIKEVSREEIVEVEVIGFITLIGSKMQ